MKRTLGGLLLAGCFASLLPLVILAAIPERELHFHELRRAVLENQSLRDEPLAAALR